jgi:hypothetical protein
LFWFPLYEREIIFNSPFEKGGFRGIIIRKNRVFALQHPSRQNWSATIYLW